MSRSVLVIQHEPAEGLGRIERVLRDRGMTPTIVRRDRSEPLPNPSETESFAALVILGGSLGVDDIPHCPDLEAEYELVTHAIATDLPTLGICLGSQLMAKALGSSSWTGEWELGWHRVDRLAAAPRPIEIPQQISALHWHRDRFSVPPGAVNLADTPGTPCQAFSKGPHLGLLFHLEADTDQTIAMAGHLASDLSQSGTTLTRLRHDTEVFSPATANLAESIFGQWADRVQDQLRPKSVPRTSGP